MLRTRSASGLFLVGIVALSVLAGATAMGPVVAQNATNASNNTSATATGATPETIVVSNHTFVNGTGGLRARFADADATTIESIPQRTINFNIANSQYTGRYSVMISAKGMNDTALEDVVYGNETGISRFGLDRSDVIGFNFTTVPPGEYEVTASPLHSDASVTVPIRVTGETGNDTGASNGTTTETGTASALENFTINSTPPSANTTANHTVELTAGSDVDNLTGIAINYSGSNTSLDRVGISSLHTANITAGGTPTSIRPNITSTTIKPNGGVVFGVDGGPALNASDHLVLTYGGVVNPPEPGSYDVSLVVNPKGNASVGPATATLDIGTANATNATPGTNATNGTPAMNATNATPTANANATNATPGTNATNANATNATPTANATTTNATNETTGVDTGNESQMGGTTTSATNASTSATGASTNATNTSTTTTGGTTETSASGGETSSGATSAGGATATTNSGTQEGGPGFGAVVAVIALIAAALVAVRRST